MNQVGTSRTSLKAGGHGVFKFVALLSWATLLATTCAFQPLPATCPHVEPPRCTGRVEAHALPTAPVEAPDQQAAIRAQLENLAQQQQQQVLHRSDKLLNSLAADIADEQDDDIQQDHSTVWYWVPSSPVTNSEELNTSHQGSTTQTEYVWNLVGQHDDLSSAPDSSATGSDSMGTALAVDELPVRVRVNLGSSSSSSSAVPELSNGSSAVGAAAAAASSTNRPGTAATAAAADIPVSSSDTYGNNNNNLKTSSAHNSSSTSSAVTQPYYTPGHGNAAGTSSGAAQPQVQRQLTFLHNAKFKLGIDLERAGVITWLSSADMPDPWRDKNLINVWDQGRLLQQSFYGCVDGSCWAGRPWLYNPVQGGSWQNAPSVTSKQSVNARRAYVEGHPRNWGKQDVLREVTFTSDIRLRRNFISVKFGVKYSGSTTHPYMNQEVPALFVDRRFSVLTYYAGNSPWTNDANITYSFPGASNMYVTPTERWAAYLQPETGWGIGVYSPKAWLGITAYRVGADGSAAASDCSYFAHLIRMQLHPGMKPYYYKVYIAVGHVNTVREIFRRIAVAAAARGESASAYGAATGG